MFISLSLIWLVKNSESQLIFDKVDIIGLCVKAGANLRLSTTL